MNIIVNRFEKTDYATFGTLSINGEFKCFTLEDVVRDKKIKHKTAIPKGEYKLGLRNEGGFYNRYKKRFPLFQKGMLEVKDVPNFKYILIHCGNDVDDTSGCLLVGNVMSYNGYLSSSVKAYEKIYPDIYEALEKGEEVTITYL